MSEVHREVPSQPGVDAIAEMFGTDSVFYAAAHRARRLQTREEVRRFWRLLDNLPAQQVSRIAELAVKYRGQAEQPPESPPLQLGGPAPRDPDNNGAA